MNSVMRLPGLRLLCGFWESLVSENIYKQRQLYKSALLQTGLVTSKLKISKLYYQEETVLKVIQSKELLCPSIEIHNRDQGCPNFLTIVLN